MVQAIIKSGAQGIYTSLFGQDLYQFIREGRKRNLFKDRFVVSTSLGLNDSLKTLGKEVPENWLVLAYPFDEIDTPVMKKF